ncbi:penicillin-binding protein [Cytophagaceae bacterium YF14B1]|uniref:Penicillin-binding protein n=1 Tax=Xanthocytophaga flava TaxID=3048013 RepID=A0AAE3QQD9_9BACT|nr:penicillin-binding protein [Xanthocytophaga flavus]MDJ1483420.1 penicillin-binding protein [Xanthocytophaga flavus]
MSIKKAILVRVRIAYLLVAVFAIGVIVRIVWLQWVDGAKWHTIARKRMTDYRIVKAVRGNIYADDGSLLATSLPFYRLAIDPTVAKDTTIAKGLDSLALLLSNYFGDRTPDEYRRRIKDIRKFNERVKDGDQKQYLVMNQKLIDYQGKKMMEKWPIFRYGRNKGGVIFERLDRRYRPFKFLAQRTIGFLNDKKQGAGLEFSYNKQLAGQNGRALFQRMSGGAWKPIGDADEVDPEQGFDIQTTININVQDVAETSLLRALQKHRANYGCVMVMEVATGEIKAIANLGKIGEGVYGENYNYAVGPQGRTNPGSTFKLASMIALLEETRVSPTDSIETGNGEYKFYDRVMRDAKAHGKVTVQEAFEVSSNIAFVKLVHQNFGNKPDRFIHYLESFGLTRPLGFQMMGEAVPLIRTPKNPTWSGLSLPWMAVGYENEISPLQILTFYNAVANHGKLIQPIIVRQIRTADETLEAYQGRVMNEKICSDATLEKVTRMLEGVVERGTAKNIAGSAYKIAGKTGTTQKLRNGRYTKSYYTSFAGFFPAHRPKYSCIVVIDGPQGFEQYGSDVAAPVFKEVADKIYALDVEMHKMMPERGKVSGFPVVRAGNLDDMQYLCNEIGISNHADGNLQEWAVAVAGSKSISWASRQGKPGKVPDVTGMTLRDALYILENRGLRVRYSGRGRVVNQSQSPGSLALKNSTITIQLEEPM